jgi:hypothetical protein
MDQYFKDEPMDPLNKGLMTFASYNAGPGRVRQLRREAVQRNLDPNVWFGNVERVASERIGRESPVSTLPVWTHAHRAISRRPADVLLPDLQSGLRGRPRALSPGWPGFC